ncbi:hypothetical protein [Dysgonomonas sp.]
MKTKPKTFVFMLWATLMLTFQVQAQVTIGEGVPPDVSAALDIHSNGNHGLLLPRIALTSTTSPSPLEGGVHVPGMFVYNTANINDVTPGIYYNDGTKWIKSCEPEWFYMPSFNLPVTAIGNGLEFNLYQEYLDQFTNGRGQFVSSKVGASNVEVPYTAGQLEYYVTAYSSAIRVNSISNTGVMNYDVLSTTIPPGSFINVIFRVVK